MSSRDVILSAINHSETRKVPLDLGATPSSGISVIAYNNLKRHLGITDGKTLIYDVVQQLAEPEESILDRFGVDVIDIGRPFNRAESKWKETTVNDGSKVFYPRWFNPVPNEQGGFDAFHEDGTYIATMPARATFFDQTYFPYVDDWPDDLSDLPKEMDRIMWAHLAHSPWDHSSEPDFWQQLRESTIQLKAQSDRALMLVCGCNLFEWGTFMRRIDNFLMDLIAEPEEVEAFLEQLVPMHMEKLETVCKYLGDVVDIIRFGDDLGMDSGPFMSPDTYRSLFKPHHRRMVEYVKKNSSMKTFLHCCGSIYMLLPDLIEVGFDVINPVQTNCVDMEPDRLKRQFGQDICFWGGGCDTRTVLNRATPAEVRDHVRERLDIFMPGGGFVFNTVHNILPDVPPENIVAMYETVAEYQG